MDGYDWLQDGDGEGWPEAIGFADIAKGVLMPHTIPMKVANSIIKKAAPTPRVVKHTQPPPIANNARQVQSQLTGLLRTVNNVEDKVDGVEQKFAIVQRASTGNQDADRFQQTLMTAILGAAPLLEQRSWFGALAHGMIALQGANGAREAFAAKPMSTVAWPVVAAGIYLARQPRPPVIIAAQLASRRWRVTMFSPDGGEIRYVNGTDAEASRSSTKYEQPIEVDLGPDQQSPFPFRARAYVFLRGSEQTEFTNIATPTESASTSPGSASATNAGQGTAKTRSRRNGRNGNKRPRAPTNRVIPAVPQPVP